MPSVMRSDYDYDPTRPRPHHLVQNGYADNYDPYKRDVYHDSSLRENMHRGRDDMIRSHDDYYRGRDNPYRGQDDPYRGHGDMYRSRDDPYRSQEDSYRSGVSHEELYSKVTRTNGHGPYSDAGERGGLDTYHDKASEPIFEIDHLATFIATKRGVPGLVSVEEGLGKLRSMELMTGIWTMRCHMVIERHNIVILDNQSGEEQDRFPIELVHKPTAIVRNDPREIYNNLLLFTMVTDPKKGDPEPNMHIFQSISASSQVIADEIQAAKDGKSRIHTGYNIPPPPRKPAPEPPGAARVLEKVHSFQRMMDNAVAEHRPVPGMYGRNLPQLNRIDHDDNDSIHSEKIELDMRKLNACCDDIEKFVARLQQAAEAFRELEKREFEKRKKDPKNHKRKQVGDGMLTMRSKPPPTKDYIEIFQKFKYAFNILARLKPYIHDPNAPELVHFLFTPLSLIYEASRDPRNGMSNIASSANAPLLTKEAKDLLLNCLTSKEQEFWMSLGDSWYLTKDQYRGYIPPYTPRFNNGWQPALSDMDEESHNHDHGQHMNHANNEYNSYVTHSVPGVQDETAAKTYNDGRYEDYNTHYDPTPPPNYINDNHSSYPQNMVIIPPPQPLPHPHKNPETRTEVNLAFARELQLRGARLVQVEHGRMGKNPKELSVESHDILEVLDGTRNWYRLRNCYGEIGHAPYTILKEIGQDDQNNSAFARN